MKYVYIAGPISIGNLADNIRYALESAETLWALGLVPFVPHLSHFWDMIHRHGYEEWMELDFRWLERCDCVLRIPGKSAGSDREVLHAVKIGKPVFESIPALLRARADSLKETNTVEVLQ